MGPGTLSGRRCLKRCSAFAVSCPRPPSAFLPALRTSGGRRHVANRSPMSSRGGLPPPSRSSLPGVLGGRLARCWPMCGAGTRPKPARTPSGPPSPGLSQPSRTRWLSRPYTCYSTPLRPLGARTPDAVEHANAPSPLPGRENTSAQNRHERPGPPASLGFASTSFRCRPATLCKGGGRIGWPATDQSGGSAPPPTGYSTWSGCTERLYRTRLGISARRPLLGRLRGAADTTSASRGSLPVLVLPSLRQGRSSSSFFIAAAPSATGSSTGAIPSDSISQNLRRGSSSEPSPFNKKTPVSMDRLRAALPHVIQPRRPRAHRSRAGNNSRRRPIHPPRGVLHAAVHPLVRSLPVSHPGAPPVPPGPLHILEESQAPSPECWRFDGLSSRPLQVEIPPSSIGAPAPHDFPES
ncbi:hypothetical protein T01_9067 [Trichinella spiralis]|uniref:Uncharacterized protein n=1 Tax=Trichinella spiralis TaxID=6334 RepID=A0A0V1AS93_TRISP|nr:hypothetical protein T01_9067 [Trichinella spiralis]